MIWWYDTRTPTKWSLSVGTDWVDELHPNNYSLWWSVAGCTVETLCNGEIIFFRAEQIIENDDDGKL